MEISGQSRTSSSDVENGPDTHLNRKSYYAQYEPRHPVFVVDETFFRSRTPKAVHWSIAWSDLMMTMFILFLTLFVYQLTQRQFLSEQEPEVIAGRSMVVPRSPDSPLPFYPISPSLSMPGNTRLQPLEPLDEKDVDAMFDDQSPQPEMTGGGQDMEEGAVLAEPSPLPEEPVALPGTEQEVVGDSSTVPMVEQNPEKLNGMSPARKNIDGEPQQVESSVRSQEIITDIYDLSQQTLSDENLEKFASVELIPDKAVRIILTGDLLFPSGQARLTDKARASLDKLLPFIRKTPYMINVVGHTDNMPMHSSRFADNWQLSTARASEVAGYLINRGHIPARQIVVSGYSYYRPRKPNTTAANRSANRRVEIILSQDAPPVRAAAGELVP